MRRYQGGTSACRTSGLRRPTACILAHNNRRYRARRVLSSLPRRSPRSIVEAAVQKNIWRSAGQGFPLCTIIYAAVRQCPKISSLGIHQRGLQDPDRGPPALLVVILNLSCRTARDAGPATPLRNDHRRLCPRMASLASRVNSFDPVCDVLAIGIVVDERHLRGEGPPIILKKGIPSMTRRSRDDALFAPIVSSKKNAVC